MSKVFIEESTLTSIGDAIRSKTGETGLIAPLDMATAISNLATGGGELEYLQLTRSDIGSPTISWYLEEYLPSADTPFMALMVCANDSSSLNVSAVPYPIILYFDGTKINVLYQNTSNSYSSGKYFTSATYEDMTLTLKFSQNVYKATSINIFYNK
jgi:hypothetical protein